MDSKIKQVSSVNMADNDNIYEVGYSGTLSYKANLVDGGFDIFLNDEEIDCKETELEAQEYLNDNAVDDMIVVSGYGTHSGRKVWQLPEDLQNEVRRLALANS